MPILNMSAFRGKAVRSRATQTGCSFPGLVKSPWIRSAHMCSASKPCEAKANRLQLGLQCHCPPRRNPSSATLLEYHGGGYPDRFQAP
jgi:hypothetical protein